MKVSKSLTDADIQTHADAHGIGDAEAVSKIKRDFEQCSLPGFQVSYRDELVVSKDRSSVDKVRAEALKNPQSLQRLAEAFQEGDVISSILPDYIKGVIPSFNIVGAVIETPEDFAKLTWTLRTPYMEVLKVAFLNRNGKAVHSYAPDKSPLLVLEIRPQ